METSTGFFGLSFSSVPYQEISVSAGFEGLSVSTEPIQIIEIQSGFKGLSFSVTEGYVPPDIDVVVWQENVTTNIGTYSSQDVNALTNFAKTAKAEGFWNSLIEVYTFCGQNLKAANTKFKYVTNAFITSNCIETDYSTITGINSHASSDGSGNRLLNMTYDPSSREFAGLSILGLPPFFVDMGVRNTSRNISISGQQIGLSMGGTYSNDYRTPDFDFSYINEFIHGIAQIGKGNNKILINGILKNSIPITSPGAGDFPVRMFIGGFPTSSGIPSSILFSAIDDGTMTDQQLISYNAAVHKLMQDLNRELPLVVATGNGETTTPQTITLI